MNPIALIGLKVVISILDIVANCCNDLMKGWDLHPYDRSHILLLDQI